MAEKGQELFTQKCSACHKMGERYVGPPLGGVVARRGPTFVMNMALNPERFKQFPAWALWARLPLQFAAIALVWRGSQRSAE